MNAALFAASSPARFLRTRSPILTVASTATATAPMYRRTRGCHVHSSPRVTAAVLAVSRAFRSACLMALSSVVLITPL